MNNALVKLARTLILAISPSFSVLAQEVSIRLTPSGRYAMLCRYVNTTKEQQMIPGYFMWNLNNIWWRRLDRDVMIFGQLGALGPFADIEDYPARIVKRPNDVVLGILSKQQLESAIPYNGRNSLGLFSWNMEGIRSKEVLAGCSHENEKVEIPFITPENCQTELLIIGMIFNPTEPNEILLIYQNGSGNATEIPADHINIIVSSEDHEYTRRICLSQVHFPTRMVLSKHVEHWRIPWGEIWDQIPEADREKLEAAGAVDLRWECGDLVSDPLPLWVGSVDESEMPEEWKGF